jgi:hypothetical protein
MSYTSLTPDLFLLTVNLLPDGQVAIRHLLIFSIAYFNSSNLQTVIGHDSQHIAMTLRTTAHTLRQQCDVLLASFTPTFGFLFFEVEFTTFCKGATAYQIKTKGESAGFYARKCANFEPDPSYPFCTVLCGLLFNQFQCPLAEGYFVHIASHVVAVIKAKNMPD